MAANAQVYQQTAIGTATPARASEAVVATLTGVAVNSYGQNVRFIVALGFTTGASSTATVVTVRRNTVAGTIIGQATTYPTTAATANQLPLVVAASEPVGTHTYVVTVAQTDASADGTVNNVAIVAIVGN